MIYHFQLFSYLFSFLASRWTLPTPPQCFHLHVLACHSIPALFHLVSRSSVLLTRLQIRYYPVVLKHRSAVSPCCIRCHTSLVPVSKQHHAQRQLCAFHAAATPAQEPNHHPPPQLPKRLTIAVSSVRRNVFQMPGVAQIPTKRTGCPHARAQLVQVVGIGLTQGLLRISRPTALPSRAAPKAVGGV